MQGGPELVWDDEQSLLDAVASNAGLIDAARGFLGAMLTMSADSALPDGRSFNVEILVPRIQRPLLILISAGVKGRPKMYFEMNYADLSPRHITELANFGLDVGDMP